VKGAVDAQAAGHLEEAEGHYRAGLKLRPDWVSGRLALGTLLYNRDQVAEALSHFAQVVRATPRDGFPRALLGLSLARLGQHQQALAELRQAEALGISNTEIRRAARLERALLLNRLGNPDAAFEALGVLAKEGDDGPAVIEAFGLSLLRLPLLPDEVPAERRAPVLLAGRGGYHMARGRRTAVGRMALEELTFRYPNEPNAHYALGTYLAPDEPEAAMKAYRRELARDPQHVPALARSALIEIQRGDYDAALPLALRAVEADPNVPAARLALGQTYLESGQVERALEELETARRMAPENPMVQFLLSRAYQRAGRAEDARVARAEFKRLSEAGDAPPAEAPGSREEP